jgi:hypothetical protein
LEVIQDIPRPNHNRYSFLILWWEHFFG